MEFVILRDVANKPHTFNLPHESYCKAMGKCSCRIEHHPRMREDRRAGRRWVVKERLRICDSIHLSPRSRTVPLNPAVLECPEVKAAIGNHEVRVEEYVPPKPELPAEENKRKPRKKKR